MKKTADEMFEELEFEKKETSKKIIYYIDLPIWKPSITFNKKYKNIKFDLCCSMKELQAINKKVEELRMGKIVQIPKIICEECKKREATRLCDYEIGHNIDLVGPGKAKRVTCDKKICTECATKINNKDYCKKHIKALKQEL